MATVPPVPDKQPQDCFLCPFADCMKAYTRNTRLREHIIKQQSQHDEKHPPAAPEWLSAITIAILGTHTRPGNLTKEEKQARKHATTKKCWEQNGDKYKANQKQKRQEVGKLLDVATKIQRLSEIENEQFTTLVKKKADGRPILQSLYSKGPSIEQWLPIKHTDGDNGSLTVDDYTFPRFVTYYLPSEAWPIYDISAPPEERPTVIPNLLSVLPGKREWKKVALVTHPDKGAEGMRPLSQTLLTEGWAIWEKVHSKASLRGADMFSSENWEDYRDLSRDHARAVELYFAWIHTVQEAIKFLVPQKVRLWDLERAFEEGQTRDRSAGDEDAEESDDPDLDAELLFKQLNDLDVPKPRKRRRVTSDEEEEEEVVEQEEEEDIYGEYPTDPLPRRSRRDRTRTTTGS